MITLKKLNIYKNYFGDIDAWTRLGSKKDHTIIDEGDWNLIYNLIQNINNGLSKQELSDLEENLKLYCDCDKTIQQLTMLAFQFRKKL